MPVEIDKGCLKCLKGCLKCLKTSRAAVTVESAARHQAFELRTRAKSPRFGLIAGEKAP